MYSLNYISVFAFIAFVSAQHISDNPCPERPVQQNFDIVKVGKREKHLFLFVSVDKKIFDSTHLAFGMMSYVMRHHFQEGAIAVLPNTL